MAASVICNSMRNGNKILSFYPDNRQDSFSLSMPDVLLLKAVTNHYVDRRCENVSHYVLNCYLRRRTVHNAESYTTGQRVLV